MNVNSHIHPRGPDTGHTNAFGGSEIGIAVAGFVHHDVTVGETSAAFGT